MSKLERKRITWLPHLPFFSPLSFLPFAFLGSLNIANFDTLPLNRQAGVGVCIIFLFSLVGLKNCAHLNIALRTNNNQRFISHVILFMASEENEGAIALYSHQCYRGSDTSSILIRARIRNLSVMEAVIITSCLSVQPTTTVCQTQSSSDQIWVLKTVINNCLYHFIPW